MTSFYSDEELSNLGLKHYGKDVKISRNARLYGAENISIGDNVRIDDFCILSGNIILGSNIHISAYVALYGSGGIIMEDYTGVSPQSAIFSAMDDFSGEYLIGPIHPNNLTNVNKGCVVLKKFSQIGTHCVVFPNVTIGEGSVLGAMTLANRNIPEWGIYIGQPARLLRRRSKGLLDLLKKREN
jgi:acetyltransferase-like isoleucine patch superfamily enzyme